MENEGFILGWKVPGCPQNPKSMENACAYEHPLPTELQGGKLHILPQCGQDWQIHSRRISHQQVLGDCSHIP